MLTVNLISVTNIYLPLATLKYLFKVKIRHGINIKIPVNASDNICADTTVGWF